MKLLPILLPNHFLAVFMGDKELRAFISFNPYRNPLQQVLLFYPFSSEEHPLEP